MTHSHRGQHQGKSLEGVKQPQGSSPGSSSPDVGPGGRAPWNLSKACIPSLKMTEKHESAPQFLFFPSFETWGGELLQCGLYGGRLGGSWKAQKRLQSL